MTNVQHRADENTRARALRVAAGPHIHEVGRARALARICRKHRRMWVAKPVLMTVAQTLRRGSVSSSRY